MLLLFLETVLVQDFHSWLADLKSSQTECSHQLGDVAILEARLQQLKVHLHVFMLYITMEIINNII